MWEWCYDTVNSGYIQEKTPYVYDETQKKRALRGGTWKRFFCDSDEYKIHETYFDEAKHIKGFYGFRIVRTI